MKYIILLLLLKFIIVYSYVFIFNQKTIINFNNSYLNFNTNDDICNLNFPLQFIKPSCHEINNNLYIGWKIFNLNNNFLHGNFNNNNYNISKNKIDIEIISKNLRRRTIATATNYMINTKHNSYEHTEDNYRRNNLRQKLQRGIITFNKNKCYILNVSICIFFYKSKISLIFLFLIFNIFSSFLNLKYKDKIISILTLILLFCINIFFISFITYNCYKCTPIIPVFQHEIGHILGYTHPNEFKSRDLKANYNYQTCSVHNIYSNSQEFDSNSIMNTRMSYLDRICISKNDKIGLFHSYKNCNYDANVNCLDANHNFFTNYIFLYIFSIFLIYISTFTINIYYDNKLENKIKLQILKKKKLEVPEYFL